MLAAWDAPLEVKFLVAFLLGLAVLPIASFLGWLKVKSMPEYWTLLEKYERLVEDHRQVKEGYEVAKAQVVRLEMSLKFEKRAANATMFAVAEKQREINQLRGRDPETGKNEEAEHAREVMRGAQETARYWEREAMLRGDEKAKLAAEKADLYKRWEETSRSRAAEQEAALRSAETSLQVVAKAYGEIAKLRKLIPKKPKKVKAVRSAKK